MEDLFALTLDRLDRRWGAALNPAGRPILEVALHGGQLTQRLGQIVLDGCPLVVKVVLVVGEDQGALLTIDPCYGVVRQGEQRS
jgi:hypothetical protein